jgi:transcription-repair coupling factor (superfamily II helicase)
VDSFLRIMDLRRSLKDHMVVRAALRDQTVTLQFAAGAPVDTEQLLGMVQRGKGRFRLSPDCQLSFRPASQDWDGLVAEMQSVLQELRAAC